MSTTLITKAWRGNVLDWVLVALLLVEGLLYLSDQYDWFAFNRHKNWTVLVAVAVVGGVLLLTGIGAIASWLISRWTKRSPLQFGLRSGLLLVAVVGLVCGWLGSAVQQARQQKKVCRAIFDAGGGVQLDNSYAVTRLLSWLTKLFEEEFFFHVDTASAIDAKSLAQVAQLPELEHLWLDGAVHQEYDVLSEEFIVQKGLAIGGVEFFPGDLRYLAGFPKLKSLSLEMGTLPESEFASLRLPESLEGLNLSWNNLDDSVLAKLGKMPNLKRLTVSGVNPFVFGGHPPKLVLNVTDAGVQNLSSLSGLRALSIVDSPITDKGLEHLQRLGELRELRIKKAKIDGSGLRHLAALANLESLHITSCPIARGNLKYLSHLKQLTTLELKSTRIDDDAVEYLGQLSQLKSLEIPDSKISTAGLQRLQKSLPNCAIYQ